METKKIEPIDIITEYVLVCFGGRCGNEIRNTDGVEKVVSLANERGWVVCEECSYCPECAKEDGIV